MLPSVTAPQSLLSADERAAIAEIEATTSILQLVTRLTNMRFAGIAKFTDHKWVVCSVHDTVNMGINVDDALDLETTLCSEFFIDPQALFIPQVSQNERFAARPVVKQYAIESYAGAPIFLPDGRLYGALCALDSRSMLFDDPNLSETLSLFARLIGCIFFANLTTDS
ncbi:GAF domain-containing protein [Pseudomonas cedrina subsp. fulgida]|nr:GAF domain-containing protein [Pseudomonas cedrina subsp. fulgida]